MEENESSPKEWKIDKSFLVVAKHNQVVKVKET